MKRKLISAVLVFVLAITWYACTDDNETKQQISSASSPGASASSKKSSSGRLSSTWNTEVGGPISYETAQAWIKTYRDQHPDAIQSRFFGKSSFERIFSNPAAVGISITYATDEKGTPMLLLVGVDSNGKIQAQPNGASVASDTDTPPSYEDASFPCPPCLPENN